MTSPSNGVRRLAGSLAISTTILAGPAAAQAPLASPGFTPAQRAEIVAIVRDALKTDPSILRDAVASLQQSQAQQAAAASSQAIAANRAAIFANAADPVAGNPRGTVTLVEFYDVRCPYCRRMLPVMDQLVRETPDLRLILKDLPILGPASVLAAKALLAAQVQGGYLKLQQALMAPGVTVDDASIEHAVRGAGLDWTRLQHDMGSSGIAARLDANIRLAGQLGITGTPALVVADQMVPGAVSLADLKTMVADLRRANSGTPK